MKKLALHWKILIGMVLGVVFGLIMTSVSGGEDFVTDWIAPIGTIFVKMLKLIAVPLILASLIKGISDLKDISKFRSMGLKTIVIYVLTTVIAITIGLGLVNVIKPGEGITQETVQVLKDKYSETDKAATIISNAKKTKDAGPLKFLEDMVPDNAVAAMSNNKLMMSNDGVTIML